MEAVILVNVFSSGPVVYAEAQQSTKAVKLVILENETLFMENSAH